jgi:hypothetical protein
MGSYQMLALFIIFGPVPLAMWTGLTFLLVIALMMDGHLNSRGRVPAPTEERVNLTDEPTCELEDRTHNGHGGIKSAKK